MALTAAYYRQQVRLETGDIGQNARHEIVFPIEATGGTWDFAFAGATASALAYPNAATTVQSELEALAPIGEGNITVTLGQRGFILDYQGDLANQKIPLPTVNGANLILSEGTAQSVPVQELQEGKANHWSDARLVEMWNRREGVSDNLEVQFLWVKLDAIVELKGIIWTQINQQTGDQRRDYKDQYDHLCEMEDSTANAIADLSVGAGSELLASAGQSYRAVPTIRTTTQARFDGKFGRAGRCR